MTFGAIVGIRQSADGKVLVNDALYAQLSMFDSSLSNRVIVLDSVAGLSNSYGPRGAPLMPYVGDSSIFVDWNAQSFVVLDGHGRFVHGLALPSLREFRSAMTAGTGVDAKGRLVFRSMRPNAHSASPTGIAYGDSIAIVRVDFDTRRVDTIARFARPLMNVTSQKFSDGSSSEVWAVDPLQPVDEWAVLSNGAVAIVRGHDYHVDWIESDGSVHASGKIPFEWKHFTDQDKQRLADSVRDAQNATLENGYPLAEMRVRGPMSCDDGRGGGGRSGDAGGRTGGRSGGSGEAPPPTGGCTQMLTGGRGTLPPLPPLQDLTRAGRIADYEPPFGVGAVLADRDANLWILTKATKLSQHGELVYDVVNAKGELFERVRIPAGRAIAGFGKGGVVYLTEGDVSHGFHLERSVLKTKA
jgi:hypothetical protein